MLKTLTLSLSFALALGLCSVSKAGGLFHKDGCTTCGIASPQGPVVSPQAPCPTPQTCAAPVVCERKKCHLLEGLQGAGNKMNCCLNDFCAKMKPKPKCYTYEWVLKKKRVWGCHGGGCGTPGCETCVASPQAAPSAQAGYGSPQASYAPSYGSGQFASSAGTLSPAPITSGDEAPPAPEVAPTPAAPAPAPPAPGPQSSLLFSTPSGN
jgi:hypothetical protein